MNCLLMFVNDSPGKIVTSVGKAAFGKQVQRRTLPKYIYELRHAILVDLFNS